jgi:hypothetical protein
MQTIEAGGRWRVWDEVWAINAMGGVIQHDRLFMMDALEDLNPVPGENVNHIPGHVAEIARWAKHHPGPIYTPRPHPDYPGSVAYPLGDVIKSVPHAYCNTTVAYAVALAMHLGVKKLGLYGCDFSYPHTKHIAESGRACVEFLLGMAATSFGMDLVVAADSTLLDASSPQSARFYGYHDSLVFEQTETGMVVRLKEPKPEPEAEPEPVVGGADALR